MMFQTRVIQDNTHSEIILRPTETSSLLLTSLLQTGLSFDIKYTALVTHSCLENDVISLKQFLNITLNYVLLVTVHGRKNWL